MLATYNKPSAILLCSVLFIGTIHVGLLRNRSGPKRRAFTLKQMVFMLLLLLVTGFFTLIIIMAKLGRASADEDPNLNPILILNIRVGNM